MKNVTAELRPEVPATAGAVGDAHDVQHATRQRVARSILENGPSTTAELAERLAVTPAAVRRHLDALLAEGLVQAREQRVRGRRGRGRPARVFALTDAGRGEFPHAYDELAASALRFVLAHGGPEALDGFARERVAGLGERVASTVEAAAPPDRVAALAAALTVQGYAASASATDAGGAQLCQHHCPVAHVAEQFPQLCEAETELFSRLLGTHVQRLATIAHGDGVCTTHVPRPYDNHADDQHEHDTPDHDILDHDTTDESAPTTRRTPA